MSDVIVLVFTLIVVVIWCCTMHEHYESVTKKDLEKLFNITANTVYQTIKACGLDTAKTSYTKEEIDTRFAPARKLLETGAYDYKKIAHHFSVPRANVDDIPQERPSNSAYEPSDTHGFGATDVIADEITESIQAIVTTSVEDIVPYIPHMVAGALEAAARGGKIRHAFSKYREEYVTGKTPVSYGFGAVSAAPSLTGQVVPDEKESTGEVSETAQDSSSSPTPDSPTTGESFDTP